MEKGHQEVGTWMAILVIDVFQFSLQTPQAACCVRQEDDVIQLVSSQKLVQCHEPAEVLEHPTGLLRNFMDTTSTIRPKKKKAKTKHIACAAGGLSMR